MNTLDNAARIFGVTQTNPDVKFYKYERTWRDFFLEMSDDDD